MAATGWRKIRVVVEIAVRDDSLSEKDMRWGVETALSGSGTFDQVVRRRNARSERAVYTRNLSVRVMRPGRFRLAAGEDTLSQVINSSSGEDQ